MNNGSFAVCSETNRVYLVSPNEVKCVQIDLNDGDIECDKVTEIPDDGRLEAVYGNTAVVLNKELYTVGGQQRVVGCNLCDYCAQPWLHKYSEDKGTWEELRHMNEIRLTFSAVSLGMYFCQRIVFNNNLINSQIIT